METVSSLILRVTEKCDLACRYCYASSDARGENMPAEDALRAVELCCRPGGTLRIQFTGGEPLLALDTMEAVFSFGRKTGRRLRLSVQTNGTLLTRERCARLKAMDCAVGVSLDGLGEENALRPFPDGSASFEKTVAGIRCWGEMGGKCNLTVVVTSQNAARLGTLPDLALWLGNVRAVGLDLFRPLGRGRAYDLSPSPEALEKGLRELVRKTRMLQEAGVPFRLRELERYRRRCSEDCGNIYCYAQTDRSLALDPRGKWWPCSSLVDTENMELGDLRDGLPQVLRKEKALFPPEKCTRCPDWSRCGGGCPAGRLGFGNEPSPAVCLMQRIIAREWNGGSPL